MHTDKCTACEQLVDLTEQHLTLVLQVEQRDGTCHPVHGPAIEVTESKVVGRWHQRCMATGGPSAAAAVAALQASPRPTSRS